MAAAAYVAALPVLGALSQRGAVRARTLWRGRLGIVPDEVVAQAPWDIWMQAVSVGEVGVASALVDALSKVKPGLKILISSSTPTGLEQAGKLFVNRGGSVCAVMPYPLDFPQAVSMASSLVSPRIFACIETELWPSMLLTMRHRKVPAVLLNGRISARSFPRYRKISRVMAPLLETFCLICASSSASAERLRALGAVEDRIMVTGNAKYEALLHRPDASRANAMARFLGIDPGDKVFVAGSVRSGDEIHLVRAWKVLEKLHHDLRLVVVPRHLRRVDALEVLFRKNSMPCIRWSRMGRGEVSRIVIVDEIGPLFDLYGVATVAFVGGSMTPKGGQNILEPAAWGCPVFYGPFMDNFEDAAKALDEQGACGRVADGQELGQRVHQLLCDSQMADTAGRAARKALECIAEGAATMQAEAVVRLLEARPV